MPENGETSQPGKTTLSPMELDFDACYRAIATRDARFDGRFFTGVRTTGIYCRPICAAPTPRRENVVFYLTAASAQAAGFRPCLRCRTETSPALGAWHGTSNTVSRALMLIEGGALDEAAVDALAARLGLGERQLRRLFHQHLGASPLAVGHAGAPPEPCPVDCPVFPPMARLAEFGVGQLPIRNDGPVVPSRRSTLLSHQLYRAERHPVLLVVFPSPNAG